MGSGTDELTARAPRCAASETDRQPPSERDRGADGTTDRRAFLRVAAGAVGAGAGLALAGCGSSRASGRTMAPSKTANAAASLPKLASRSGTYAKSGITHVRSRPDLRPPEIRIDVRPKSVVAGVVLTDAHGGPF
jgi:hypothetical protein